MIEILYPRTISFSPIEKKYVQSEEEAQPYLDKGWSLWPVREVIIEEIEEIEEEPEIIELKNKLKDTESKITKLRGRPKKKV